MNYLNVNSGIIAITMNMWSSNNKKRVHKLMNDHYIDDSWTLHNRTMMLFFYSLTSLFILKCTIIIFLCILIVGFYMCLLLILLKYYQKCWCIVWLGWVLIVSCLLLTLDICSTNDVMVEFMLEKMVSSHFMLSRKLVHILININLVLSLTEVTLKLAILKLTLHIF